MKRRFVIFMLAICLVAGSVMPASATVSNAAEEAIFEDSEKEELIPDEDELLEDSTGEDSEILVEEETDIFLDSDNDGLFAGGSGTEADPYLISSVEQLKNMPNANGEGWLDIYFKLTTDLTLDDWKPISLSHETYGGTNFDGGGHTIHNLKVTQSYYGRFGYGNALFYSIKSIKNLTIENAVIDSDNFGGEGQYPSNPSVFAGHSKIIENCCLKGTVLLRGTGNASIYGHVETSIKNCKNYAQITVERALDDEQITFCGIIGGGQVEKVVNETGSCISAEGSVSGIVEVHGGEIKNCINHADITLKNAKDYAYAVGIAYSSNNISGCKNFGKINNPYGYAAGIVHYTSNGTLLNCSNEGEIISGREYCGSAGIVYEADGAKITNCYNLGTLTGDNVAGIVNDCEGSITISSCYNKGELRGAGLIGGIVSELSVHIPRDGKLSMIENCYNSGCVSKEYWDTYGSLSKAGGIIGSISFSESSDMPDGKYISIKNCYNNVSFEGYADGANKYAAGIIGCFLHTENPDDTGGYRITTSNCYCLDKGYGYYNYELNSPTDFESYIKKAFAGVKQCTDAELRKQETYDGFEFGSVWLMGEDDYPYPILIGVGGAFDGYEITLVPNGGAISSTTVYTNKEGKLSPLPWPKDSTRRFIGWFLSDDGNDRIDEDYIFGGDTTIYAHWGVYDESKKVSISSEKPHKGEGGVAFLNISVLSGSTASFDIEFETDHHVSSVNLDAESLKIYEYDDDGYLSSAPIYTLRKNNAKVTYSDKKESAGHSIVKIHLGSSSGIGKSMNYNTRYSIEIDKDFLVFDDPENYTCVDSGVWNFTTGVVTRYNNEEEPEKKKDEKKKDGKTEGIMVKANVNLPYWFDASNLDFSGSSYHYDWDMAVFAYMTTLSAFESADATDAIDRNIEKEDYEGAKNAEIFLVDRMGFENFDYNDGYRHKPTTHSIGVCAASKKMHLNGEDYTVIILPIRGAGYGAEWASNARVGDGLNHAGFEEAADKAVDYLTEYIDKMEISGKIKVLVTGYSRAAGTTNLVAAKLDQMVSGSLGKISSASFTRKDVFGYCFEPPATTRDDDRHNFDIYGNIHCFINQRDLVPMVPTQGWGYGRYGKEFYYRDVDFAWEGNRGSHAGLLELYKKFTGEELTITGMYVKNKPVSVSEWTRTVIEGLADALEISNYLTIQPKLEEILQDGLGTPMGSAVEDRLYKMVGDAAFEYNITDDLLFSIISAYLFVLTHPDEFFDAEFRAKLSSGKMLFFLEKYNILYGALDDSYFQSKYLNTLLREKNIFLSMLDTFGDYKIGQEHSPALNFAWLVFYRDSGFVDDNAYYKKLYVNCPVDVEVYDEEGRLSATIINDKVTVIDNNEGRIVDIVAYIDADEQKVIRYPAERNYSIKIKATGSGTMDFSEEYYAIGEGVTRRLDYLDIPIQVGTEITGTENSSGDIVISKGGKAFTPENHTELVKFNVALSAEGEGYAVGSGEYTQHDYVVARAISHPVGEFDGWFEGDKLISRDKEYRFRVDSDVELTARFHEAEGIRVSQVEPQTYSGYALKPELMLYDGAQQLIQGTDYTVSYKNNKNAFTFEDPDELTDAEEKKAPQAVIKMKGNYAGKKTVFFAINPLSIENETLFEASLKKGKKTVVIFKYNGKALKKNVDYKVDNILENSVVITGIGNFSGTHEFSFESTEGITNVLMSKAVVEAIPAQIYTGTALTASALKAKDGITPYEIKVSYPKGTLLTPGKDYAISRIIDSAKVGTATVVIKGLKAGGKEGADSKYSFIGEKRVTVKINQRPINTAIVTGADGTENLSAVFNKAGSKPEDLTVAVNGNVLKAGRDYTVKYSGNTSFYGTGDESTKQGKLTVTGKGNYKGSKSLNFKITKRPFTKEAGIIVTATDIPQAAKAGKYTTNVKVYDSEGRLLKAGTDYEKNILYTMDGVVELDKTSFPKAGDVVTVKVTGRGGYCADVYSTTYRILEEGEANDIAKAKITIDAFAYKRGTVILTGDNASHVNATMGKTPLFFSTDGITGDFCVVPGSYVGNDRKGTAQVTFIGINDYSGTKTVSFKVGKRSLAEWWKGLFR